MGVRALLIGGGNMGEAIVGGAIEHGATSPADWFVVDPNTDRRAVFEGWGVATSGEARDAIGSLPEAAQVWFAVKPQVFPAVGASLAPIPGRVVVSIMAGVTCASLTGTLGDVRPVRVMPNTPVRVGMGVSAIATGAGVRADDADFAKRVFGAVGETVELPESLIDAFTGVAGSGPAYLFLVAEALARGAIDAGLDPGDADRIVRALLRGSAELLATSDRSPGDLRIAVTSPGGTTAAGLGVLEERGVGEALRDAVLAARDRGRELGSGV